MADNNVFITGAADGAFADALNGLPPWASEQTLFAIKGILEKTKSDLNKGLAALVSAGAGGGGSSAAKQKEVNEELDKYLRNLRRQNEADKEARKRQDRKKKDEDAEHARAGKSAESGNIWAKTLGLLTTVGKAAFDVQKQYVLTSKDLYDSGVNLLGGQAEITDSYQSLKDIITLTGVRLETLQKYTEKYSAQVNAIGIKKFATSINGAREGLDKLGYSYEDQLDLMGTYLQTASYTTSVRNKSEKEIIAGTLRMGENLRNLSQQFGISTDKLKDNIKALTDNSDSMLLSATYGEQGAENMRSLLSGLDPKQAEKFLSMMSSGFIESTEEFKSMAQAGAGNLATQFAQILKNSTIDPKGAQESLMQLSRSISEADIAALGVQAKNAGNTAAKAMLDSILVLRKQANIQTTATKTQEENAKKGAAVNAKIQSEAERLSSAAQKAFAPTMDQIGYMTTGLTFLNNQIDRLIGAIDPTILAWVGGALALGTFVAGVTAVGQSFSLLKSIFGFPGGAGLLGISSSLLGGLAKLAGGVTLAATAGYAAGTLIYKGMEGTKLGDKILDSIGAAGVSVMAALGNKEAIETKASVEVARIAEITKSPAPSTIASPSAVPANPKAATTTAATEPANPTPPGGTGIEKPVKGADINSLLGYQSNILEQVLLETKQLVSVNKDILKYARVQS